jgi:hypothetical protein
VQNQGDYGGRDDARMTATGALLEAKHRKFASALYAPRSASRCVRVFQREEAAMVALSLGSSMTLFD